MDLSFSKEEFASTEMLKRKGELASSEPGRQRPRYEEELSSQPAPETRKLRKKEAKLRETLEARRRLLEYHQKHDRQKRGVYKQRMFEMFERRFDEQEKMLDNLHKEYEETMAVLDED